MIFGCVYTDTLLKSSSLYINVISFHFRAKLFEIVSVNTSYIYCNIHFMESVRIWYLHTSWWCIKNLSNYWTSEHSERVRFLIQTNECVNTVQNTFHVVHVLHVCLLYSWFASDVIKILKSKLLILQSYSCHIF